MKVVNLVTQMEAGGAQQAAIYLSSMLQKKGYKTEVWFLYLKRPTYIDNKCVRVVLDRRPSSIIDYILIILGIVALFRKHRPEVVISHTYYANIIGQLAAFLFRVKARLAVQHNPAHTYPKMARLADYLLGSSGLYKLNIVVSKAAFHSFNFYPAVYRKRLRIIHNGIPMPVPIMDKKTARRRFGLPVNNSLIVNTGRLAAQKNQRLLIQILKYLPDVYLAIAGDGELKESLMEEALSLGVSDRVFLLGEITPDDISNFLFAGDIFVFPSIYEAMPFALIEAMAAGLPVIASDIPSIREVLGKDGESARLLVSPQDQAGFCTVIKRVLEDHELSSYLSNLLVERARLFEPQRMVNSYENSFLEFFSKVG